MWLCFTPVAGKLPLLVPLATFCHLFQKKPTSLATLRANLAAVIFQIIFLEHWHLQQWPALALASALALFPAAQQPQVGAGSVCCWNPFTSWWLLSFEPTLKTENMLQSSCHTCKQTQWAASCIQDNHRPVIILNTPGNLLLPQCGYKRCKSLVFESFLHKQGRDFIPVLFSDPVFTDFLYTVAQLNAIKFNYHP